MIFLLLHCTYISPALARAKFSARRGQLFHRTFSLTSSLHNTHLIIRSPHPSSPPPPSPTNESAEPFYANTRTRIKPLHRSATINLHSLSLSFTVIFEKSRVFINVTRAAAASLVSRVEPPLPSSHVERKCSINEGQ